MKRENIETIGDEIHITTLTKKVYINGELVYFGIPVETPKKLAEFVKEYGHSTYHDQIKGKTVFIHTRCEYKEEDFNIMFRVENEEVLINIDFENIKRLGNFEKKFGENEVSNRLRKAWVFLNDLVTENDFEVDFLNEIVSVKMYGVDFTVEFLDEIIPVVQKYREITKEFVD